MMLSPHFAIGEFACRDGTAVPPALIPNLRALCDQLELLREALVDRPIIVTSGYRTLSYNTLIGGAAHSQHLVAKAADIRVADVSPEDLYHLADAMVKQGRATFGGLGLYRAKDGRPHGWLHADVGPLGRRWTG